MSRLSSSEPGILESTHPGPQTAYRERAWPVELLLPAESKLPQNRTGSSKESKLIVTAGIQLFCGVVTTCTDTAGLDCFSSERSNSGGNIC